MSRLAEQIAAWMQRQVTAAGAQGLVFGLSGGVDSAVIARLSQLAMPQRALGVLLPCHSDPQEETDACLVADHFQLPTVSVNLDAAYNSLIKHLRRALAAVTPEMRVRAIPDDPREQIPRANIGPRLRMASLYFLANSLNYLVAGTGNRSEIAIGYFTKYGDGGVDILPLGGLLKSQVHALARDLNVPPRIIEKVSTAGLWRGQTDESEMGFTYQDLEAYLKQGPDTIAPALALRIERLMRLSEHKRRLPPEALADGTAEDTEADSD